jgi:hypothetical protein
MVYMRGSGFADKGMLSSGEASENASRGWNGRKRTISWYRGVGMQRVGKEA